MTDVISKEEIFNRIKPVICQHLDITGIPKDKSKFGDNVTLSAKLEDDLGADSLDRVGLTMAYEEDFDISLDELSPHDTTACVTVGEQVDKIHSALTAKASAAILG